MFWKEDNSEEIESLENEIEDLKQDVEKWKKRYEKTDEKRSQLAKKKQEAEKEVNELKDKLRSAKEENVTKEPENNNRSIEVEFEKAKNYLNRIKTIKSGSESLITVYYTGEQNIRKDLSKQIDNNWYKQLSNNKNFIGFFDDSFLGFILKTRPFYNDELYRDTLFKTDPLLDFIEREKIWVIAQAGESKIVQEQNGDYKVLETIKNRINRKHSKGGFSQSRFERKRDKQIEEHVDSLKDALEDYDNIYLIGNQNMCSMLEEGYLGGFDPNKNLVDALYNFRFKKLLLK